MAKFLGFLLGVAVALAGPAVFGVLAAPGGIELNAKEMALAYGIGALIFWAVVSYFSGAGALGAFVAFGTLVYCWLWIPNRTTNFLNDVPGVTNGMIEGSKQYTLNGVVPILGVISLVYAIQLIVQAVRRRRRERADAERLQREQEAAQEQQEADVAAVYPVAGGTYQAPAAYESHTRYDDLFDEPEPVQPRNQADEQTRQFPVGPAEEAEHTRQFPDADADSNYSADETVVAQAPAAEADEPATPPLDETQPVSSTPHAAAPAQPTPPADAQPPEAKPAEAKPAEAKPAEPKPVAQSTSEVPAADQAEVDGGRAVEEKAERAVAPKEQMGAQYRERMEDPEDTGEFHLAFENPVVRPA
ncbi:hypothetical protein ABZX12_00730 [Kribbella sp. NPDC003505]|uniref:hypothetical protein n=1 Tax=Kribbella sp. NPDC003505 TaxID=3154448 RepID=UPI0033BA587A